MCLLHALAFIVVAYGKYYRLLFAPTHRKMRYLRVRSNLKPADRFRYKAKPAGNSAPITKGFNAVDGAICPL